MKYKNTTFVNILLIYSHYKLGKPFLKGAPFFLATPCTCTCTCIYIIYNIELFLDAALVSEFCVFHSILLYDWYPIHGYKDHVHVITVPLGTGHNLAGGGGG